MKKIISIIILFSVILTNSIFTSSASDELNISAKSAVVICAETGEIVYSKNHNTKLSMASTTKIMTSILALEYGAGDEYITVTKEMITVEGSSMGLKEGDKVSLKTLVKGMLLESGNDAANATAYIVSGSIQSFVELMNQKALEIGMTSTSFETPSGLDGENHYSTAYDMALLGAYAIRNPEFRSICSAESLVVYYGNEPYRRVLSNHNRLLKSCDGVFGIKTGFTKKSGRCLVSAVERDGKTLVAVTLNASDDWNDHRKMYDFTFSKVVSQNLKCDISKISLKVVGGDKTSVSVSLYSEPSVTTLSQSYVYYSKVYIEQFVYAPLEYGEIVGFVEYYDENDKLILTDSLYVTEKVDVKAVKDDKESFLTKIFNIFR